MRCYQDDYNMNDDVKVVCKMIDVVYRLNDVVYKDNPCWDCLRCLQSEKVFAIWSMLLLCFTKILSANDVYKVKRLLRLLDMIYHLQKSCWYVC